MKLACQNEKSSSKFINASKHTWHYQSTSNLNRESLTPFSSKQKMRQIHLKSQSHIFIFLHFIHSNGIFHAFPMGRSEMRATRMNTKKKNSFQKEKDVKEVRENVMKTTCKGICLCISKWFRFRWYQLHLMSLSWVLEPMFFFVPIFVCVTKQFDMTNKF